MSAITGESAVLQTLRYDDALSVIAKLCDTYYVKYRKVPDTIYINSSLQRALEHALYHTQEPVLPVSSEDIHWYHCPPKHADKLVGSEFVIVTNSLLRNCDLSL